MQEKGAPTVYGGFRGENGDEFQLSLVPSVVLHRQVEMQQCTSLALTHFGESRGRNRLSFECGAWSRVMQVPRPSRSFAWQQWEQTQVRWRCVHSFRLRHLNGHVPPVTCERQRSQICGPRTVPTSSDEMSGFVSVVAVTKVAKVAVIAATASLNLPFKLVCPLPKKLIARALFQIL